MMKKYEMIVAGHICLDLSPAFASAEPQSANTLFRPGRLINMNGITLSTGGPVSNTGFAMSRMGIRVLPMAKIGDDAFGRLIADIADEETRSNIPRQTGVRTSYSIVLSPPGIDRIILHDPAGNNAFTADDIDYSELENAALFHFGYPPLMKKMYEYDGAELARMFSLAKQQGVVTSLDMSLPDAASESGRVNWQSILEKTLPFADLFMPSIEEALFMLDRAEYDRVTTQLSGDEFTDHLNFEKIKELGTKILSMGSKLALIKCGAHGIYIRTSEASRMSEIGKENWADMELFQPTYRVEDFKSALGGGDTTIAGFLSAMIRGFSLEDSARLACLSGALCCTTYDAISAIRPIEQIYKLKGNKLNTTQLPLNHLRYCEKERLFLK
jgi:sugar/nucleoside kinase (ribokinase family)